jgi:predicted nucleic acid-binding protein
MYLIDTNIWLELLLEQEKEEEVRRFFQSVDACLLSISDYSLYSIGIILTKLKKYDVFIDFISDGYQYIAAEKNNYVIVSFDSDFDRTLVGRKTPREVLL